MATKKKATTAKKAPAKKAAAKKEPASAVMDPLNEALSGKKARPTKVTKTQATAAKRSTAKALEARKAAKKSPQAAPKKAAPKKAAPKKATVVQSTSKTDDDIGGERPAFLDASKRPKAKEPARAAPSVPIRGAKRPAKAAAKAAEAPEAAVKGKRTSKAVKAASKANGKTDMYGFREGSKDSKAAAMYARKSGASTSEIKKALGQPHLNCLKAVEKAGHKVQRVKETDKKTKKTLTRYYIAA